MDKVVNAIKASMRVTIEHFKASHENMASFFLQIITIARGNTATEYPNTLKNPTLILGEIAQKFALIAGLYAFWYELIFTINDEVTIPTEEQVQVIVRKMFEFLKETYQSISEDDVMLLYYTITAIFLVEGGVTTDIEIPYECMHVHFDKFLFAEYKPVTPRPVTIAFIDLTVEDGSSGGMPVPDDSQGFSLPRRRPPRISRPPQRLRP
jgi:hypothetical protein